MELVYNSDSFVVVQIKVQAHEADGTEAPARGGFEIVDKFARKEIFLEGLLAERFVAGVKELVDRGADERQTVEAIDNYIAGFTALAQQPVLMH